MIVLFCGQKGGTGKSTLATAMAAMRKNAGSDVLLVDCDPQGTTSEWAALRDEVASDKHIPCVSMKGATVHKDLADLAARYDDLVVDAGGRDSAEMRSAMLVADVIVTPIRPAQPDAWTLATMDELIAKAHTLNPEMRNMVVINLANPNPRVSEGDEATEFAAHFENLTLAAAVLRDRVAHRRAFSEGLCAAEVARKDAKAAAELTALYTEVFSHGA